MSCAARAATWVCDLCREVTSVTLDYCTGCGARRYPISAGDSPLLRVNAFPGLSFLAVVPAGVGVMLLPGEGKAVISPPGREPGTIDLNAGDVQAAIDRICRS